MERSRYRITAVERTLAVLDCFTMDQPELTFTEIQEMVGEQKGTVFRFVATLVDLGYLELDSATRRYRLGRKILGLGQIALGSIDVRQRALPILRKLSEEVNENVNLSILDQGEIVYLERIVSRHFLNMTLRVGSRLPVHCSSMGKVLVAFLPDAERERLLQTLPLQRFTPKTNTDPDAFRKELEIVRAQGFAICDEELVEGLITIAAPVWGSDGQVKAAVNISAPTTRLNRTRLEEVAKPALLAAVAEISAALGAPLQPPVKLQP